MSRSDFRRKLRLAAERRSPLRKSGQTNAYRIFHADADGVPGVTVDWFDAVAVVSLYGAWDEDAEKAWMDSLLAELRPRSVYLKRRPRIASRLTPQAAQALAPEQPLFGPATSEKVIAENGLSYLVRPAQGLAVGLYLDMRDARRWIREQSRSRRVLNCFAYTCSFGICARAGGAERVVNVDLSRRALEWGEQNARLNSQAVSAEEYLAGDIFDWLGRLRKRKQSFDLAVLDPPSFATAKRSRFTATADWPRLIEATCAVVDQSGLLLACCNQTSISPARFERMVHRGFEGAARRARLVRRLRASNVDFPSLPGTPEALKILVYQLD